MPNEQDDGMESNSVQTLRSLSRRRWLQAAGLGVAAGVAVTGASASSDGLPNTITIDSSSGESSYELAVSESLAVHPDIGGNEPSGGEVQGTVQDGQHAYTFSGHLTYLDVTGNADVTLQYEDHTPQEPRDRLEIVAATDGDVTYEFTSQEPIHKVLDNGDRSANEDADEIRENDDGTWTALGSTADGNGDTFDLEGEIEQFEPIDGQFTLFFEGEETTVTDLTGQEPPAEDRTYSYSFVGTGSEPTNYFLELEEGGNMIASDLGDAVIEEDLQWVSDDGLRAAGQVQPGTRHTYEYDSLALDVTIEGSADAYVNGAPSNLDLYPREGASGNDWKSGFPWQDEKEISEHEISLRSTSRTPAMYYEFTAREITGGDNLETDDVSVQDSGYLAEGQIGPSGRDTYTVRGKLQSWDVVDDSDRYVDESRFALVWDGEQATLDDVVEGGYEAPEREQQEVDADGTAVGGGPGYGNIVTSDEADYVVSSRSELSSALSSAGSGDVVFIESDAEISMNNTSLNIGSGVTLASDRGRDGSQGALLRTSRGSEPGQMFRMYSGSRITGIRMLGPWADGPNGNSGSNAMTVVSSNVEIDNCEIGQFSYAGVNLNNGEAHVHHNTIYENNRGGLGYGVTMGTGQPVLEYNYFNFNRHSVASTGNHTGYICRFNHFGPKTTGGVIDIHTPGGVRSEVHNNVIEAVDQTAGSKSPIQSVQIRGVPDDSYVLYENWFFNPKEPASSATGSWTTEAIIQPTENSWRNVEFYDNYYGEGANVSVSDIIPGYNGDAN